MRRWQLAIVAAVALGIASWGFGLSSRGHQEPTGLDRAVQPLSIAPLSRQATEKGVLAPRGTPVFNATFGGTTLDKSIWSTCYPDMNSTSGCTNFGNAEYQWYLPSQVTVSGGYLRLTAQRTPTPGLSKSGTPQQYQCRSGMITSFPGLQFEYGYLQVVAQIPGGTGLWPALWLNPADNSWPPEIDMLESWGTGKAASFFHPVGAPQVKAAIPPQQTLGWHTFSLSWTSTQLTWLVDGKVILTVHDLVPHQKMYFIADLAESDPAASAAYCKGTMLIRSVTLWSS